jgi:hydrogenase-4 component B
MFDLNLQFFLFLILCATGTILAALLARRANQIVLAWIGSLSSLAILLVSGNVLISGYSLQLELWNIWPLGKMLLKMDRLSALFVFITGLVFLPVSIFSAQYMNLKKYEKRYSLRSFGIFYHLLFASIVLLLIAGDVLSFLLTWESMSIFSYLLVNYEHEKEETTRSGYLMLSLSEAGTLATVLASFLLARSAPGLDFPSLKTAADAISEASRWGIFCSPFSVSASRRGWYPPTSGCPGPIPQLQVISRLFCPA